MLRFVRMAIPKVIYQTFPTKQLPRELAENVKRIKDMNPGWEHVLYDDLDIEEFLLAEYPLSVRSLYRSINPLYGAARADFFRYLLIYKFGGVYLDIKSSTTKPLDKIVSGRGGLLICQWPKDGQFGRFGMRDELPHIPKGEFQNWHVIAEPQHDVLGAVISQVSDNIANYRESRDGVGLLGVARVTGSISYSKVIWNAILKTRHFGQWKDENMHGHGPAMMNQVSSHERLGLQYELKPRELYAHRQFFRHHHTQLKAPVVLY